MTRKNIVADKPENEAGGIAPAHILQPEGVQELSSGSLLVVCSDPGFKRAGIAHERLHVYRNGELTPSQISQIRREPKLTLVEVG